MQVKISGFANFINVCAHGKIAVKPSAKISYSICIRERSLFMAGVGAEEKMVG